MQTAIGDEDDEQDISIIEDDEIKSTNNTSSGGGGRNELRFSSEWVPDNQVTGCKACKVQFTITIRRHHCRCCGCIFCSKCSRNKIPLQSNELNFKYIKARVCDKCFSLSLKTSYFEKVDIKVSSPLRQSTSSSSLSNSASSSTISLPSSMSNSQLCDNTSNSSYSSNNNNNNNNSKWNKGTIVTEKDINHSVQEEIKEIQQEYKKLREQANELQIQRDESYRKATEYLQKGHNDLYQSMLNKGKSCHQQMEETNWKAARKIFYERNYHTLTSIDQSNTIHSIDFYGLSLNETIVIFQEKIKLFQLNLINNSVLNLINIGQDNNTSSSNNVNTNTTTTTAAAVAEDNIVEDLKNYLQLYFKNDVKDLKGSVVVVILGDRHIQLLFSNK
ncbi:hypothetical protein CYY_008755 [Polysphondylium violaceum]|uniref:FYVE-type domain-containing protein n=1 Tax=Polysphondylium violaceum TaxID=133409 RepID=A0A8J4PUP5_9MYCE|nr:hypothetical protein CYY_008755 [Polysphondylium violaceum]